MCAVATLKSPVEVRAELPRGEIRLAPARAADHQNIFYMQMAALRGVSASEFQAQLDSPGYEPADRLVAHAGSHLAGHVLCRRYALHWGALQLPAGEIHDLVTLPEFRHRGLGTQLLAEAEARLASEGALLATVRAADPAFFLARGWSLCPAARCTLANARDVLAHLLGSQPAAGVDAPLAAPQPPLNIRPWRHVEHDPLVRLYRGRTPGAYGSSVRSDDYWHWLISRRGYDRIYVAIDGPDLLELTDRRSPLVGYAVVRRERIVELVTAPGALHVGRQLLARACHDAIERNDQFVRYEGPFDDPLHEVLQRAGGCRVPPAERAERALVKVLAPHNLCQTLLPYWNDRWRAARLHRPGELGLACGDLRLTLLATARGMKLASGRMARSRLTLPPEWLPQLLLGQVGAAHLLRRGLLQASTRLAEETATALFPGVPFWQSGFDSLPG